jgi:hypothetical protein
MNGSETKKFLDAIKAADIKSYMYCTDLSTNLYSNDHEIIKTDIENEIAYNFRKNDYSGSTNKLPGSISVRAAKLEDIHEVRTAGDFEQIKKFMESLGFDSFSDADLKILAHIDGFTYDIKPATGDYLGFTLLSTDKYNKLSEDDKIFIKSMKDNMPTFKVNTKEELTTIISHATELFGNKCDLNWIDVSSITDMSNIFAGSSFDKKYNIFNGDIS